MKAFNVKIYEKWDKDRERPEFPCMYAEFHFRRKPRWDMLKKALEAEIAGMIEVLTGKHVDGIDYNVMSLRKDWYQTLVDHCPCGKYDPPKREIGNHRMIKIRQIEVLP
jgi:hypothetical protein